MKAGPQSDELQSLLTIIAARLYDRNKVTKFQFWCSVHSVERAAASKLNALQPYFVRNEHTLFHSSIVTGMQGEQGVAINFMPAKKERKKVAH